MKKIAIDYSDNNDERALTPQPVPNFLSLGLESGVGEILINRWEEVQKCVDAGAHLSAIIIMGSMLEGLLLGVCQRNPAVVNRCPSAPKHKDNGKVKHFAEWKLSELIDVAHQVGWLDMDVRKFSHSLRDFRNLIHPYEQMVTKVYPDEDTCSISWLVVQAAINDLARVIKA